jgi:hypothetical protein
MSARSEQAMVILQWIFLATRPLKIDELRHVLAVVPGDTMLDWDNFPTTRCILDCCLGLVVLDEATSSVWLVHHSLHTYFSSEYDHGNIFQTGHSDMTTTCLTYMSFHYPSQSIYRHLEPLIVAESDPASGQYSADNQIVFGTEILEDYTFLDYAICNWGYHARRASGLSVEIRDQAIDVLMNNTNPRCISWDLRSWPILIAEDQPHPGWPISHLLEAVERGIRGCLSEITSPVSALHIAAYYGVQGVSQALINNPLVDINAKFRSSASPLLLAAIGN